MPVVSSQMDLLEQPLLYTQVGMVSFAFPPYFFILNSIRTNTYKTMHFCL